MEVHSRTILEWRLEQAFRFNLNTWAQSFEHTFWRHLATRPRSSSMSELSSSTSKSMFSGSDPLERAEQKDIRSSSISGRLAACPLVGLESGELMDNAVHIYSGTTRIS